jgi:hypothetical protein
MTSFAAITADAVRIPSGAGSARPNNNANTNNRTLRRVGD